MPEANADAQRRLSVVSRTLAEKNATLVSLVAVKVILSSAGETRETMRMVRKWGKIEDGYRADYEAYLRTQEYITDPMADGEKRPGRWRVLRVYSTPEKTGEQSQGIYQMLLYWPDNDAFGEYCGESSPLAHTDIKVFYDSPVLADCEHKNIVGHVFSAANRLDPESGLWSGELRDDISREFGAGLQSVYGGPLVQITDTGRKNSDAPPTGRLTTRGQSRRINWGINRYGKVDWSQTDEQAIELLGVETTYGGKYETTKHKEGRNSATPTDGKGTGDAYTRGGYSINQYGWYDWTLDTVEPVLGNTPVETNFGSVLSKVKRTENKNQSEPKNLGAGEAGKINHENFSINQYGLIDWSTTEDEARPAEASQTVTNPLASEVTEVKVNQSGLPSPSAGPGRYVRGGFNINRYGWYDWQTTTETAIERQATITYGSPLATTTHEVHVNSSAPPAGGPGGIGETTHGSFSINRYGCYDWSLDTTTATEKTVNYCESSLRSITNGIRFENCTAIPTVSTTGRGTPVNRVSVSINNFGLLSGDVNATGATPPFQMAACTVENSADRNITEQDFFNQAYVPDGTGTVTPTQATVTTYSRRLNEFGLYDYTRITTIHKSPYQSGVSYTLKSNATWEVTTDGTKKYLRGREKRISIGPAASASAAAAMITNYDDGSHIMNLGNGLWGYHRVEIYRWNILGPIAFRT